MVCMYVGMYDTTVETTASSIWEKRLDTYSPKYAKQHRKYQKQW